MMGNVIANHAEIHQCVRETIVRVGEGEEGAPSSSWAPDTARLVTGLRADLMGSDTWCASTGRPSSASARRSRWHADSASVGASSKLSSFVGRAMFCPYATGERARYIRAGDKGVGRERAHTKRPSFLHATKDKNGSDAAIQITTSGEGAGAGAQIAGRKGEIVHRTYRHH
jgi:hypothetical protein